jgi:glutathione reductase (NADPH)
MSDTYDLVAVGSGAAAQVVTARVRHAAWRVAVVDERPFGGTCALRGCDPKKMLVSAEEAIDAARRMRDHGVDGDLRIDWPALIAFKRSFTDPIPAETERRLAESGVDVIHGAARFVGPDRLAVEDRELEARHVLIATGARPTPLRIPGEDLVITSDAFMELNELPERIVFIGGGYIAAEFSHLAARAGANVTVLQRCPRLLPRFDPDLVDALMERFSGLGVAVHTDAAVTAVERTTHGLTARARRADGGDVSVDADLVVHAAGRSPNLDGLALAAGGVAVENGRLRLNRHLQSETNPRVYAAGDAAAKGPPLTPVSTLDAKVVASNLLEGPRHEPNYLGVPSVAFTLPPIASAGIGEAEALEQGLKFRRNAAITPGWFTALRMREPVYGHKVLVAEDGRILGAHLVGPSAEEVINLFALAIRHRLTADALKDAVFTYPTAASDVSFML